MGILKIYNVQGLPSSSRVRFVFNSTNLEDEDRNQLILVEQESLHEIWRRSPLSQIGFKELSGHP